MYSNTGALFLFFSFIYQIDEQMNSIQFSIFLSKLQYICSNSTWCNDISIYSFQDLISLDLEYVRAVIELTNIFVNLLGAVVKKSLYPNVIIFIYRNI